MKIYLVRHGRASLGLTDIGKEQIQSVAAFLKEVRLDLSKTVLFSSPADRAVESAEIMKSKLGLDKVEVADWLQDDWAMTNNFINFAIENQELENLIAVSHEPDIRSSVGEFSRRFGKKVNVFVNNGSIHLVDLEQKVVQHVFEP